MTDINAAPHREQTPTAVKNPAALVVHENENLVPALPTDPTEILWQDQQRQQQPKSRKWMLWTGGGLLAAQLFAPMPLKPAAIIGDVFGQFYAPIMEQSLRKQVRSEEQGRLSGELGRLQSEYSQARAKCGFAGLLGPEAQQLCNAAVDQNFVPAIRQIQYRLRQLGN
ncbi:MAG: hypothetical protein JKY96_02185 [Phycisphaerales bacterium]|nr:hypothetical protein [Phycisphaerales bacterium]